MDKKARLLLGLFAAFVVGATTLLVIFSSSNFDRSEYKEVDWRKLGELDFVSGVASEDLKSSDGKKVKIPGFMVPLEDNSAHVTEFLLVPSPQACIHVPPPPPNQMVYVKMDNDKYRVEYGPIWIYGTLQLTAKRHQYGESSFQMVGTFLEPYGN